MYTYKIHVSQRAEKSLRSKKLVLPMNFFFKQSGTSLRSDTLKFTNGTENRREGPQFLPPFLYRWYPFINCWIRLLKKITQLMPVME